MEMRFDMGCLFLHQADGIVLFVDEDDLFHHTLNLMLRMSPSCTT